MTYNKIFIPYYADKSKEKPLKNIKNQNGKCKTTK